MMVFGAYLVINFGIPVWKGKYGEEYWEMGWRGGVYISAKQGELNVAEVRK